MINQKSLTNRIGNFLQSINPFRWVSLSIKDINNYLYLLSVISKERDTANWKSHNLRVNNWGKVVKVINIPNEMLQPEIIQNSPQGISAQMGYPWIPDVHMLRIQKEVSPIVDDYFLRLNLHQIMYYEIKRHPEVNTYSYLYFMRYNWRMFRWINIIKLGMISATLAYFEYKFDVLSYLMEKITSFGG